MIITSADKRKASKLGITPEQYILTIKAAEEQAAKDAIKAAEEQAKIEKLAAAQAVAAEQERYALEVAAKLEKLAAAAAAKEKRNEPVRLTVLKKWDTIEYSRYFTREDSRMEKEHEYTDVATNYLWKVETYMGDFEIEISRGNLIYQISQKMAVFGCDEQYVKLFIERAKEPLFLQLFFAVEGRHRYSVGSRYYEFNNIKMYEGAATMIHLVNPRPLGQYAYVTNEPEYQQNYKDYDSLNLKNGYHTSKESLLADTKYRF